MALMQSARIRSFLLIAFSILVAIVFWFRRPVPLSPVELSLIGRWSSVSAASSTPDLRFVHDYRRDRTVVKTEVNTGSPPAVWMWRVEDGVLIVEQQRSLLDRLFSAAPPDIGSLELISATPRDLVLGPRDEPSVFVRAMD